MLNLRKKVYLRFGKWAKSERSGVGESYRRMVLARTGVDMPATEHGVSVYDIKFEKGFIIPDAYGGISTFYDILDDAREGKRPIYLVTGTRARFSTWYDDKYRSFRSEGSDGEPLLRNVEIVRKVKPWEIWHPEVAGYYPGSPSHREWKALPDMPNSRRESILGRVPYRRFEADESG